MIDIIKKHCHGNKWETWKTYFKIPGALGNILLNTRRNMLFAYTLHDHSENNDKYLANS